MIEKHLDLTDNKLVLVSGSGFTPTALQKADLEGVEALTLEGISLFELPIVQEERNEWNG